MGLGTTPSTLSPKSPQACCLTIVVIVNCEINGGLTSEQSQRQSSDHTFVIHSVRQIARLNYISELDSRWRWTFACKKIYQNVTSKFHMKINQNSRHHLRAFLLELSHLALCERLNNAVVNVPTWLGILN